MRLNALGIPVDVVPIPVALDKASQTNPKVCWSGSQWLVVYQTTVLDGNGGYYQAGIAARRVSANGTVVDAQAIPLNGLIPSGYGFDVASDGANWVVINQGGSMTNDTVAMRVSSAGIVLDPPTRTVLPATYFMRSNFKLAYASGVYLMTFDDAYVNGNTTTGAVRFDPNLNILGGGLFTLHPTRLAGLASNGSQFLACWTHQRPDFYVEIRAKRMNSSGVSLDGNGLVLSPGAWPGPAASGAWWDGVQYRVGWIDFTTPKVARITTSGGILDPGGATANGLSFGACAGSGAGTLACVSTSSNGNDTDVKAQCLTGAGTVSTPVNVALGVPMQSRPDVATSGRGHLLVYLSGISGSRRVMAQVLDAQGLAIGNPIQLAAGTVTTPRVAWNGSVFLVTWGTSTGISGARLNTNGVVLDPTPISIMTSAFGDANLAALGNTFLVTGRRYYNNGQSIAPLVARVRGTDGVVLDTTPKLITIAASYVANPPVVVALGGKWLVAYVSNFSHDDSGAGTAACFVTADGTVEPGFTVHGPFSTAGGNGIFEIGLASNGSVALLAQPQELTSGVENDMLIHTISSSGVVGPMVNVTPWEGNQYRPKIGWDGQYFVMVYQDQKNRYTTWTMDQLDARCDIFGMRITSAGAVVDPQGFALGTSPLAESDPNLACSKGQTLFVASRFLKDSGKTLADPASRIPLRRAFMGMRIQGLLYSSARGGWPVAVATASPGEGDLPFTVQFSSAGSASLNGSPLSITWNFGDGAFGTGPSPTHTYLVEGEYVATMTVVDQVGLSTSQAIKVWARKPNLAPILNGTQSATSGRAPLDVTFTANGSYDPDGYLLNVTWTADDGYYTYGNPSYWTFSTPGVRHVTMSITDSRGATSTRVFTVNVLP